MNGNISSHCSDLARSFCVGLVSRGNEWWSFLCDCQGSSQSINNFSPCTNPEVIISPPDRLSNPNSSNAAPTLCPAYFSRHKSHNRIKPNPINFHKIVPQTMSSTESPPKITIPIVSPPRPSSSPKVAIGSPTCVGRSIEFDDHLIEKENKKNTSESVAVVSPPPKQIKKIKKIKYAIDANIVAKRVSASVTSSTSTPTKIYALDRHSCDE